MMLHKVSDAVGGKIKVVASSRTYACETVVKMFPFGQCKLMLLKSALVCTYMIDYFSIILIKLQIMGVRIKVKNIHMSSLQIHLHIICKRSISVCCELRIVLFVP